MKIVLGIIALVLLGVSIAINIELFIELHKSSKKVKVLDEQNKKLCEENAFIKEEFAKPVIKYLPAEHYTVCAERRLTEQQIKFAGVNYRTTVAKDIAKEIADELLDRGYIKFITQRDIYRMQEVIAGKVDILKGDNDDRENDI